MPHIIIKLYAGRDEDQKMALTEAIVDNVVRLAGVDQKSVSVAIEEFDPADWAEKVYRRDILPNEAALYKKPGYNPFDES